MDDDGRGASLSIEEQLWAQNGVDFSKLICHLLIQYDHEVDTSTLISGTRSFRSEIGGSFVCLHPSNWFHMFAFDVPWAAYWNSQ